VTALAVRAPKAGVAEGGFPRPSFVSGESPWEGDGLAGVCHDLPERWAGAMETLSRALHLEDARYVRIIDPGVKIFVWHGGPTVDVLDMTGESIGQIAVGDDAEITRVENAVDDALGSGTRTPD